MLIYGGSSNGEHQHKTWRLEFGRSLMLDFILVGNEWSFCVSVYRHEYFARVSV